MMLMRYARICIFSALVVGLHGQMEAKGMRMQGESNQQQARFAAACRRAGGFADGPICNSGGMAIDPHW